MRGNSLVPPTLFGRFAILCAILRQLHLILRISFLSSELALLNPDYFFVDQLSAGLPYLHLLRLRTPIFFYCHFPDLLLVQGRQKWWKKLYRIPFDRWEEWSMGFADAIAVNSKFTRKVVGRTWPGLVRQKELKVVYPCIDTKQKPAGNGGIPEIKGDKMWKNLKVILSINRFERKKDIGLAIRAYAGLSKEQRRGVRLVIAGGYDNRVHENVSYHSDLDALASSLGLQAATAKTITSALAVPDTVEVLFLLSVPNALKEALLRSASLLAYTPSNEHFGIVPLEAMLAGVPVLAADNGGPTETVQDGVTGWLRNPGQASEWTAVMYKVLHATCEKDLQNMSRAGVERVKKNFAVEQMADRLINIFNELNAELKAHPRHVEVYLLWLFGILAGIVALAALYVAWVVPRMMVHYRRIVGVFEK